MRNFWLFRSDIKSLEYYHQYKDLETFEKNCHDFYLLQCLYFLKKGYFDGVTIWRLSNNPPPPIVFIVNKRVFTQMWVRNFEETLEYARPVVSFWRGGFKEYDQVTKINPKFFGRKLYLGAGRRTTPQWGGKYDLILVENERDLRRAEYYVPFYKTASPEIFKPLNSMVEFDICWPCNFSQIAQKGQEFFIREISKSRILRNLKIVHCGNKPAVGKNLCKKYRVNNIKFMGSLERPKLNEVLNRSKVGIVLSNKRDGCPRILTEIIMSGTPLLVRNTTRFLNYYKNSELGVVEFNEHNMEQKIIGVRNKWVENKKKILAAINTEFSFAKICEKNIEMWQKL